MQTGFTYITDRRRLHDLPRIRSDNSQVDALYTTTKSTENSTDGEWTRTENAIIVVELFFA
jgi:hypothetical protein